VTHKILETIHGRPYVIEVVSVSQDRWRAQIARRGASNALMPFYGATPDEAAKHLASWLTRAGQRRDDQPGVTSAGPPVKAGRT
jgi:hypothetical protein